MSLSIHYFGQQNESIKKAQLEPCFQNTQNLSKKLIILRGICKILGYFEQYYPFIILKTGQNMTRQTKL